MYLVLAPDFAIVGASQAYLSATMTRREDIIGRGIFDIFPDNPDDPAATGVFNLKSSLERVARDRVPDTMAVQKYDIRKPESEGGDFEARYWSPHNSPVFGPDRSLRYIIHRVEDVTEFVKLKQQGAEQQVLMEELNSRAGQMESEIYLRAMEIQEINRRLVAANRELETVNKELEAFSYSVSHDLRAPLRSIDGFSQALLEDYGDRLDGQAKDYLCRVRGAAQRMALLIDELLQLSRVTRAEFRRGPVNLSELAEVILADLQKEQRERKAEIRVAPGLVVDGDAALLRIVLENLLGNAWKFSSKRDCSRIQVESRVENGKTIFFVRDNGAGFDPAYSNHLFGAFQRLHRQDEFSGTGVGLATVQRIIQRHGGRIWAEGAVDKGATFYFLV